MLNLTNNLKKIIAVVAIAVTLVFAFEAPSEAAPQLPGMPTILAMDSIELAVVPETESSQPIAESNSSAEATEQRSGCPTGNWCCYCDDTSTYECIPCTTPKCLDTPGKACGSAGCRPADDDFCR